MESDDPWPISSPVSSSNITHGQAIFVNYAMWLSAFSFWLMPMWTQMQSNSRSRPLRFIRKQSREAIFRRMTRVLSPNASLVLSEQKF